MSEWKEYKLGELADITSSKRIFFSDYVSKGIPFYRSKEIIDKSLGAEINSPLYISEERYNDVKNKFGSPIDGDLLISAVGERSGIPYVVKNDGDFYFKDGNLIWLRKISSLLNIEYFCYWLKSDVGQNTLESLMIGSAQKALTIIGLKGLHINLPTFEKQQAIAEVLSSLDDKIDLLHRQNKTLEQMAETLFKKWFVEEAKSKETILLDEYVETINGVSYKSSELNSSTTAMVSLKSFDRTGGFRIDGFKEFIGKYKEKQVVKEGDLIVAHTDITQDAEVIGNPALVIGNSKYDTLVISMDMVKVIPKVEWVSIEFLYYLMRTREFKGHCEGHANGSTVLHLNKQAIPTFEFPKPDKNRVMEFTIQSKEFVKKIFNNHKQINNLTQLRETLLPKLMNGEIKVN